MFDSSSMLNYVSIAFCTYLVHSNRSSYEFSMNFRIIYVQPKIFSEQLLSPLFIDVFERLFLVFLECFLNESFRMLSQLSIGTFYTHIGISMKLLRFIKIYLSKLRLLMDPFLPSFFISVFELLYCLSGIGI